ncbi:MULTISPECIES: hypothetical protein [unclassified Jeotgalibaca]|uniref:hypothetical protein n=1 Tax=unclassified Jeotgalibaca TaxID=2621505 RepID=UPI003FCFF4F5
MPEQIVYVYYDTVGNNVLSKGIVNMIEAISLKRIPQNLLLLNNYKHPLSTYDNYTGFNVIKEQENVVKFLKSISQDVNKPCWIDYSNIEMLHQLTPVEISEILYIAHAHNYLHSPFYYKLQNNYIYLTLPNNFAKVYYRHLEEFWDLFTESITQRMKEKVNGKRKFFQKERLVSPFTVDDKQEVIRLFKEGICISFRQMTVIGAIYSAPLFVVEDQLSMLEGSLDERSSIGDLTYDADKDSWKLTYKLK